MPEAIVHIIHDDVEDGQFNDALEDITTPPSTNPRQGHNFIDDEALLAWSASSDEEGESEPDEFAEEEDMLEAAAFQTLRAEDEDWEIAERGASGSAHPPPHAGQDEPTTQTLRSSTIAFGSTSQYAPGPRLVSLRH